MGDVEQQYSPSSLAGGSSAPWEAQYRRRSEAARDALRERLVELDGGTLSAEGSTPDAPLMIFLHGGYWQALTAADSLFPASDLARLGWAFAAVEYPLAPAASIDTMIAECTRALRLLAARRRDRTVLVGHSAGAHLAAMIALAQRPPMVIDTVVLVSGIYDLRPIVATTINQPLGLDDARATRLSPMFLPAQPHPHVVVAWGEVETEAFATQSRDYATHLAAAGSTVATLECVGRNHFDIVFDLAEPSTPLGALVLGGG